MKLQQQTQFALCSMLHTRTPLHTLLPPLCPPLFHFATRHFLWLISLIACGLRKLVKIFLLAPNVAAPATPTPPLSARLSMLCYLQHSLNVCFALSTHSLNSHRYFGKVYPKYSLLIRVKRVSTCRTAADTSSARLLSPVVKFKWSRAQN